MAGAVTRVAPQPTAGRAESLHRVTVRPAHLLRSLHSCRERPGIMRHLIDASLDIPDLA
jgi:hypothetical protein